uniref:Uncharacterized protein n=1 Tax=Strigamia maritima TaxID=126957 RepID=T1IR39_STRMM
MEGRSSYELINSSSPSLSSELHKGNVEFLMVLPLSTVDVEQVEVKPMESILVEEATNLSVALLSATSPTQSTPSEPTASALSQVSFMFSQHCIAGEPHSDPSSPIICKSSYVVRVETQFPSFRSSSARSTVASCGTEDASESVLNNVTIFRILMSDDANESTDCAATASESNSFAPFRTS